MIGERLRQIRIKLGYKEQKDFAEVFPKEEKITPLKISRLENENNKITPEFLNLLVKKFNINTNWIITGKGEMFIGESNKVTKIINGNNNSVAVGSNNKQNSDNTLLSSVNELTKHVIEDFQMLDKKNQKAIHLEILTKLREEGKI